LIAVFESIKAFFKHQDITVYIRFKNQKVYLTATPSLKSIEEFPMIAVTKKNGRFIVKAVGEAVMRLPETDTSVVYTPFSPFETEPENFELGEKVLSYLLKKVMPKSAFVRPKIIIHPDKSYLSEMEEVAYRELAISAGAREAVVYVGKVLEHNELERFFTKK